MNFLFRFHPLFWSRVVVGSAVIYKLLCSYSSTTTGRAPRLLRAINCWWRLLLSSRHMKNQDDRFSHQVSESSESAFAPLPCYTICQYIVRTCTWPFSCFLLTKYALLVMTLPFPSIQCNQSSPARASVFRWGRPFLKSLEVERASVVRGVRSGLVCRFGRKRRKYFTTGNDSGSLGALCL